MEDNREFEETRDNGGDTGREQEDRTFTQEEVDEIVRKRLARERKRTEPDSGDDREKSLEERELKVMAREKLLAEGMPSQLADILRYSDEETLEEAMNTIKSLQISKEPRAAWGQRQLSRGGERYDTAIRRAMGLQQK